MSEGPSRPLKRIQGRRGGADTASSAGAEPANRFRDPALIDETSAAFDALYEQGEDYSSSRAREHGIGRPEPQG
ncbi:hypothetical protein EAO73_13820 [Streptomyces sp. col6]|nr:hypothetical protein EAO73_13820 [Streptomyces sp. col6]